MELSKNDTKMTKGLAIIFMVLLHLFCIKDNLPFEPLIYIGNTPFVYYVGLFGDCCVVMFCFCSGYAHQLIYESKQQPYKTIVKRLPAFIINFWVICIIFSVIGLITGNEHIPGSLQTFIRNMLLYRMSYNGAWWFVVTYILICLFSFAMLKLVKKSSVFSLILFSVIYVVSYLIRFHIINITTDWTSFNTLISSLSPTGTSLLPYIVGAVFYKHKIFTALRKTTDRINKHLLNLLLLFFMSAMFVAHAFVESLFVAIFTGIGTIICFNLWQKSKTIIKLFSFIGKHSTNIWLTHMFFYLVIFKNFVFIVKYPLLCFILMMLITICVSVIINFILKHIYKIPVLKKL